MHLPSLALRVRTMIIITIVVIIAVEAKIRRMACREDKRFHVFVLAFDLVR